MKEIFIKIIIWLFERYALDEWIHKADQENKQMIMEENNLESEEEFLDWHSDRTQEPLREAYNAGREDGYAKAMDARRWAD